MRLLVTATNLLVLLFILVLIHGLLIDKNARKEELIRAVDSSMNLSFDKLNEEYLKTDVSSLSLSQKEELKSKIKSIFCTCLSKRISSDSNYEVNFKELDLDKGYLDVEVIVNYKHLIKGREYIFYEKLYGLY